MGKYDYFQKAKGPLKKDIHPVWSGIGLLISIISPIISGAAALVLLEFGKSQTWPFLYSLSGYIHFSAVFYQIPLVKIVANYLSSIPDFKALVLFFIIFLMLFSSLFAFINAVLFRLMGPPRYSDLDAPAPRIKTKKYTR